MLSSLQRVAGLSRSSAPLFCNTPLGLGAPSFVRSKPAHLGFCRFATMSPIYDFTVKDPEDKDVSMAEYKGKVLLIVNVASKCGFTPQYTELEELQKEFGPKGFEVLGFPCNQFMNQEPGDSCSIRDGMRAKRGVTFPMFAKIKVNGSGADPLYAWLKKEKGGFLTSAIKWNFAKFLVDRDGKVVERYAPATSPNSIKADIEKLI